MTSEHKACKNPECHSAEFWILPDGRIICADSDCYAEYGRVAGPGAERIFSPVTGSSRKLDRDWARITPGIEGRLISVSLTDEAASAWIDVRPERVPAAEEAGQLTLGDAEPEQALTGDERERLGRLVYKTQTEWASGLPLAEPFPPRWDDLGLDDREGCMRVGEAVAQAAELTYDADLRAERDKLAGQIAAVRAIAEPWAAGRDSGDERIAVRAVTAAAILDQLRDGAGS